MLGIAVGIDYALFIVSRYRTERADGHDAREATARANGTAGSAVVFAGLTLVIALAGLAVVNLPILTTMGLAAAGAVVIAVLVATTLVPALLGFAGERVRAKSHMSVDPARPGRTGPGQRWISCVLRKPAQILLLAVIALGWSPSRPPGSNSGCPTTVPKPPRPPSARRTTCCRGPSGPASTALSP